MLNCAPSSAEKILQIHSYGDMERLKTGTRLEEGRLGRKAMVLDSSIWCGFCGKANKVRAEKNGERTCLSIYLQIMWDKDSRPGLMT